MKNKYKLLLLMLLMTIVSGCTANYNIKINMNGSVEENIDLAEEKNVMIKDFTRSKFKSYVSKYITMYGYDEMITNYNTYVKDDLAGIKAKNSYKDIYEYANRSLAISQIFKSLKVNENDNIIKIKSIETGYEIVYRDNDGNLNYTDSYISISLPYEVISTNANKVYEETNTYTWNLDEEFNGIEIEYNTKKYYSNNIFKLKDFFTAEIYLEIVVIIIAIILVCTILILGTKLIIRERKML